jgi:hypothetical protein
LRLDQASAGKEAMLQRSTKSAGGQIAFPGAFLWIGIIFTVLARGACLAFNRMQALNFWFYCMSMPLTLGILLIVMGAGSKTSRWLYVNVDRSRSKDQDGPRHISLASVALGVCQAGSFVHFGVRYRWFEEYECG